MKRNRNSSFFEKKLLIEALKSSFVKLDPRNQLKNPVMFVVFVGAIFSTFMLFTNFSGFNLQIVIWLWFTSLFANFAEAIAEGRGKAQADSLRKLKTSVMARKMNGTKEVLVAATELRKGDVVVCEANDIIPIDGEIIEGIATVDESAITGESAPVIRESGGDRSAVTGGTVVLSDRVLIQVTCDPGDSFIDRMIALVEGAKRQKTP
ncbi:MAG: potassium-transporting ATPase subunit B, partial [Paludibacter sp.]